MPVDAQSLNLPRMDADAFMRWYDEQADGPRYELLDGQVFQPERESVLHARVKMRVAEALRQQIVARGLRGEAMGDGMCVRVDAHSVFIPDAWLRCGLPLPGLAVLVEDPLIVVEIVAFAAQPVDALAKLAHYFNSPAVAHYLIVLATHECAIHHRRLADGQIVTRVLRAGVIRFDPPGVELDLAEVWGEG